MEKLPEKPMPKLCIHGHSMELYGTVRKDPRYDLLYWGCKKCTNLSVMRHKFNLTKEQVDDMLEEQNYACAICFNPFEETGKRKLSVDHDHKCCAGYYSCGKCVRGFLYMYCNSMLGLADDSPEILLSAINYLGGRV